MKKFYVWALFYVNKDSYNNINDDLIKRGYSDIKVVVPTVSILKKRFKGKDIYEEVPILFNYGFIKMPSDKAYSREFLRDLKKDINGILGFVKSPESMHPTRKRKRIDSEEFDDYSIVATVSRKEVRKFKRLAKENNIYTYEDIVTLRIGSYVTLRGYPFEGLSATVKEISLINKTVTVVLYPGGGSTLTKSVPLENIVYSIYQNYEDNFNTTSNNEKDIQILTEDTLDNFYTKNTY